jgi:hypothetical protein
VLRASELELTNPEDIRLELVQVLMAIERLDEAKALLEEFRTLETRSDLTRQLDQQEQRVRSSDRRVQAKIDKLFSDTRQLLTRFLDPRTSNELAEELLRAK